MTGTAMKRASLSEIAEMDRKGELHYNPDAPAGESLGPDFWDKAVLIEPKTATSVHLKLDSEVFAYFKQGGKGHLTRMQNILKAYVEAQRRKVG